jgi:hypothetical protein
LRIAELQTSQWASNGANELRDSTPDVHPRLRPAPDQAFRLWAVSALDSGRWPADSGPLVTGPWAGALGPGELWQFIALRAAWAENMHIFKGGLVCMYVHMYVHISVSVCAQVWICLCVRLYLDNMCNICLCTPSASTDVCMYVCACRPGAGQPE